MQCSDRNDLAGQRRQVEKGDIDLNRELVRAHVHDTADDTRVAIEPC